MKSTLFFLFLLSTSSWAKVTIDSFDFVSNGQVKIGNSSGDVDISKGDSDKIIVKYDKANFDESCRLDLIKKSEQAFEVMVYGQNSGFSTNLCKLDLKIEVPPETGIELKMGTGNTKVTKISGDIQFYSGTGAVFISATSKYLKGVSGTGEISVEGKFENIDIRTGSAPVTIDQTFIQKEGQFNIRSGTGDILFIAPKGSILNPQLFSTTGSIENEFPTSIGSPYLLSLNSGTGQLRLLSK